MSKIALLHIILLMLCTPVFAQVPDSTSADSSAAQERMQNPMEQDSTDGNVESEKLIREKKDFEVIPWRENPTPGEEVITNDSLLRWQIWPNWGDYQAYRPDVISFRQGTSGRIDAFHINGYEPYEQKLRMEGITLNNPITGLPNYNMVPHRKIGTALERFGGHYESNIRLRDYYLLKPISYLNYDEAGGNFRNLEFLVSQNFTKRTNLEVSFWDRRGGGYYPNSEVQGSQMVGRVYHHLKKEWLIRGMYLRNQLKNDEPFGYVVQDPLAFVFDEFASPPVSSNGVSELTRWDFSGGIYHRKDTASAEDAGLEFSLTNHEKNLRFSGDTLDWKIRSLITGVFKEISLNKLNVRGELQTSLFNLKEGDILTKQKWMTADAIISVKYGITHWLNSYGILHADYRTDSSSGFDATGGLKATIGRMFEVRTSLSAFSRIPTMQVKYWNANNYSGNAALKNENGISVNGSFEFRPNLYFTFGASGRLKQAEHAVYLTPNGSFTDSSSFNSLSGNLFAEFENHRFEFHSSGTFQQYNYSDSNPAVAELNHQDMIFWLRNNAFVKGYVFDRAAYLKFGLKTLLSPLFYNARTFNTELEFWQGNSVHQPLPPFFRLDAELSARVRKIMVLIRWENALDGLGQAGYFEAAGFPMPPRRLMVGIRAQFRN